MKRSAILTAAGVAVLAAAPAADAAYRPNYASWSKLNDQQKIAYVEGLNDGAGVVDTGSAANVVQGALVRGRTACLNKNEVSSHMLVALIDTQYQNDPSARDLPPMTIYLRETYRICRQDIEASIDAATNPTPAAAASPQ